MNEKSALKSLAKIQNFLVQQLVKLTMTDCAKTIGHVFGKDSRTNFPFNSLFLTLESGKQHFAKRKFALYLQLYTKGFTYILYVYGKYNASFTVNFSPNIQCRMLFCR